MMDTDEASLLIGQVDEADHDGRTKRLLELTGLLPDEDLVGFSGQAAQWLFEDVKATWLYGCFTSTVLTAHAFCSLQISGLVRLRPDDPGLPEEAESLESLAAIARAAVMIDVDVQARLLSLHDSCRAYVAAHLHEEGLQLERRLLEADQIGGEHPLLADARAALAVAVNLVYRQ